MELSDVAEELSGSESHTMLTVPLLKGAGVGLGFNLKK